MASFFLAVRGIGETLAIGAPTVFDAIFGKVTVEKCDVRLRRWATRLLDQADVSRVVHGLENLDPTEVFVVMSNHRSLYDIPLLIESFPRTLRMVTKTELFRVPIWGEAMKQAGFIEIDRNDRKRAKLAIEVAKTRLANGINVWIAPEGTRSRSGELLEFKSGGFRLASGTGLRILPAAIRGTENVLSADGVLVHRGAKVEIRFGDPVDSKTFGKRERVELMGLVRSAIEAML